MSYSEKQVNFSQDDIQVLQSSLSSGRKMMMIASGAVVAMFGIFFAVFLPHDTVAFIIGGVFMSLVVTMLLFVSKSLTGGYNKDLKSGYKLLIKGQVTSRYMEEIEVGSKNKRIEKHYYILIGDKKVKLDRDAYEQIGDNDHVEIEQAPFSKKILRYTRSAGPAAAPAGEPVYEHKVTKKADGFMTDEDVLYLQKLRTKAKRQTIITTLTVLIPFGVFLAIAFTVMPAEQRQGVMRFMLTPSIPVLLVIAYTVFSGINRIKKLNQDLQSGQRTSLTVSLKDKRSTNRKRSSTGGKGSSGRFYYLITTENRWIEVSEPAFHEAPDNGSATLVLAPVSQTVLDVVT